jgi:hypothetical protein
MEDIEKAADEAQKIIDKQEASNPIILKIMNIVKKFIKHERVLCYGGTAINNLLPKEKQFYDVEKDIPDYDFFSENPQKHSTELSDILIRNGIKNVEVKPGIHLGTFKVFAEYNGVADISFLDKDIFKTLWKERITKDTINYVPPNFLRMSVYLELSRPRGFVERWKKVYKRLKLLNEEYPIKCNEDSKKVHEENINPEIKKQIENLLIKEKCILLGFNASSIQLNNNEWYLPLDVLVEPEQEDEVVKKLSGFFKGHHKSFHEYAELLPAHTDITKNNNLLVRVFQTNACHSYHESSTGLRIGSIPTLLNFFFSMLYSDREFIEHTSKDRIICTAQKLIDAAENSNKRRFKLLTPIDCIGKQKGLIDMKKEKSDLYEKLSTRKNSRAFLKFFFSYTPKIKTHFTGGSKDISKMFPKKPGIDYSKLIMTDEGMYSITKNHDSQKIIDNMKKISGSLKTKTIADLTGNVGGDTIRFGMNFKKVDSYEIDEENYKALKNNVQIYDLKNVSLHKCDSTKSFNHKVDILYMDPPWGGPEYKEKEKLDLFLGDINIGDYLSEILNKPWKPLYVFMKVPSNFNLDSLMKLNVEKIYKFKIRGFLLLGFKT